MCGNTLSKYINQDVNDEKYREIALLYCAHCEYKTTDRTEFNSHMEIDHTEDEREPLAEDESFHQEEVVNAVEVWKIYKLLQRMKNK